MCARWLLRSQIQFSAWKNRSLRACRYRERERDRLANLSISLSNSTDSLSPGRCEHCERVESRRRRTFQWARLLLHSFILAGSYMTRPLSLRTRSAYTFLRRSLYISIRTNNIPFLSISLLISPFGRSVAKTHQHTHTHTRDRLLLLVLDLSVRANVAAARVGICALARTNNTTPSALCSKEPLLHSQLQVQTRGRKGHCHLRTHWPHLAPEINYFRTVIDGLFAHK
jgi:hypothetical protein